MLSPEQTVGRMDSAHPAYLIYEESNGKLSPNEAGEIWQIVKAWLKGDDE